MVNFLARVLRVLEDQRVGWRDGGREGGSVICLEPGNQFYSKELKCKCECKFGLINSKIIDRCVCVTFDMYLNNVQEMVSGEDGRGVSPDTVC